LFGIIALTPNLATWAWRY